VNLERIGCKVTYKEHNGQTTYMTKDSRIFSSLKKPSPYLTSSDLYESYKFSIDDANVPIYIFFLIKLLRRLFRLYLFGDEVSHRYSISKPNFVLKGLYHGMNICLKAVLYKLIVFTIFCFFVDETQRFSLLLLS
jgi:hypothetical protein